MGVSRTPVEIIGRDAIDELWGEGFTVVPRISALEFPENIIPRGMAYQWNNKGAQVGNWTPVPAQRHPGLFAPYGYEGDIDTRWVVLCERPKSYVDAANDERIASAEKNVTDWMERQGVAGLMGSVRVGTDERAKPSQVGETQPSHLTKVPSELMPHISEIFAERDTILPTVYEGFVETERRRLATEQAIEKVRARLQKDPVT